MSWVKEAFQRGEEDRRRTIDQQRSEELNRQKVAWEKASFEADEKVRIGRERQLEVERLKQLLDKNGAVELLKDVQREVGGDIIFKQQPREREDEYSSSWAAYGLVDSRLGRTVPWQTGGYKEVEEKWDVGGNGNMAGLGHIDITERYREFSRGRTTSITAKRVIIGIESRRSGDTTVSRHIYTIADIGEYERKTYDSYRKGREIPLFLRHIPNIPGIIDQETRINHTRGEDNLLSLSPETDFMPDGRVNSIKFNLSPHYSAESMKIDGPISQEMLRDILAVSLEKIA